MKTNATTEIYIRSFEEMKPEYLETAQNYFIYVMGLWLVGWFVTILCNVFWRNDDMIAIKWYWSTWLNKLALTLLFLAGMYYFGK